MSHRGLCCARDHRTAADWAAFGSTGGEQAGDCPFGFRACLAPGRPAGWFAGKCTLAELGFQVRSVLTTFGEVNVQICTCPLAEVAETAPEVVRGIQQGLIQEVVNHNAESIGGRYRVTVTPDPRGGSCEIGVVLSPDQG